MMPIKGHLNALLCRARCDRLVLVPMLDKLNPQEQQALWHLLQNERYDALSEGANKGARQPWRHGVFK